MQPKAWLSCLAALLQAQVDHRPTTIAHRWTHQCKMRSWSRRTFCMQHFAKPWTQPVSTCLCATEGRSSLQLKHGRDSIEIRRSRSFGRVGSIRIQLCSQCQELPKINSWLKIGIMMDIFASDLARLSFNNLTEGQLKGRAKSLPVQPASPDCPAVQHPYQIAGSPPYAEPIKKKQSCKPVNVPKLRVGIKTWVTH